VNETAKAKEGKKQKGFATDEKPSYPMTPEMYVDPVSCRCKLTKIKCDVHVKGNKSCLSCKTGIKYWMKHLTSNGIVPRTKRKMNGFDVLSNAAALPVIIRTDATDQLWNVVDRHAVWFKYLRQVKTFTEDDHLGEYPMWFAVKMLAKLPDPKYYLYAPTLPLLVVYHGFAYVVAPVVSDLVFKCPSCGSHHAVTHVRERFTGYVCEGCDAFVQTGVEHWPELEV
jgi:hypothetical protein